jgi:hypothetical protein
VSARAGLVRVLSAPASWALGASGFLARGGIVIFAIPFWTFPTPVGFTLLLPPDAIGAAGPSPRLVALVSFVAVALVVALAGAMAASAASEIALYERLLRAGSSEARASARRGLFARIVAVEVVALVPVVVAVAVALQRVVDAGRAEFLAPSDLAVPFAARVAGAAWPQLALVVASLVVADLIYGTAVRPLLRRGCGALTETSGMARGRAAHLRGRAAAWVAGWIVTLITVVPGFAAALLAWRAVSAAAYGVGSPQAAVVYLVAVLTFVLVWLGAVVAAGGGSAARGVLLSVAADR